MPPPGVRADGSLPSFRWADGCPPYDIQGYDSLPYGIRPDGSLPYGLVASKDNLFFS